MKSSNYQKAILALIIANTIWGAGSPIFKWALYDVSPFTLAFLRFFLAAVFIAPFAYKDLHIEKKDIKTFILLAFFGITINIPFFFLALQNTLSINAPIIGSSAPIFILISSMVFLKEKPKIKTTIGALLGLLGVLTIVVSPVFHKGITLEVLGNLFLIVSMLSNVVYTIIAKEITKQYKPTTVTFYSFAIGSFTFIPMFAHEITTVGFLPHLTMQGIVGIAFGAIFSSCIAYFLFYWGMKYLLASEVGLFSYLDPISAIIIAAPLLGEIPSITYIVGSLLVFGGIYTAEGRIHYHPFHKLKRGF